MYPYVDVVFYGNSITCGSSFQDYFPEVSICNLGYPGDNLDGLTSRSYMIATVKPEKVFVMGGINGHLLKAKNTFRPVFLPSSSVPLARSHHIAPAPPHTALRFVWGY